MTDPTEEHSAHIEVIPAAAEEEQILANLLELYAHDFSEFHDLEIGGQRKERQSSRHERVAGADYFAGRHFYHRAGT